MKNEEFIYHNIEGKIVKEKLMLMFNDNGHIHIDEADYTALYINIEELYLWALYGKEIYEEWMKIIKTDNAINTLLQMLRQANTIEDFIYETTEIYKISNVSAEALANLSLSELTELTVGVIQLRFKYYSLAVEQLGALIKHKKALQ